jgi:competence protein ComEC
MEPREKVVRIRLILFLMLVCGVIGVYVILWGSGGAAINARADELSVTFLDVGQGDAIFIESPTGVQVLIDGGPNASVLRALSEEMGFLDRSIDIVIATHADKDHIGGLVDVLDRYEVAEVVMTENRSATNADNAFIERVEQEGAEVVIARRGLAYELGDGALLTVLFPDRDPSFLETNTASIVARLTYGTSEFLFTGDSPIAIEEHLVASGITLESDVLKVGHHGSRTSTSEHFVQSVRPQYAIISAGKDNSYGHPHIEVMNTLERPGVISKNTAEEGSITFVSDGTMVHLED